MEKIVIFIVSENLYRQKTLRPGFVGTPSLKTVLEYILLDHFVGGNSVTEIQQVVLY